MIKRGCLFKSIASAPSTFRESLPAEYYNRYNVVSINNAPKVKLAMRARYLCNSGRATAQEVSTKPMAVPAKGVTGVLMIAVTSQANMVSGKMSSECWLNLSRNEVVLSARLTTFSGVNRNIMLATTSAVINQSIIKSNTVIDNHYH